MQYLGYCGKYNHILIELNLVAMKKYLVAIISSLLAFVGCTETTIGYENLEDFINSSYVVKAENVIFYTSSDGKIVEPDQSGVDIFGANIVSNTYKYGLGIIEFDRPVTTIGSYAFSNCTSLTSVIIPNSVTSIGDWAFRNCSKLTSVTIPNSVTSIGDCAFEFCFSLTAFDGKFASDDNRCLVVDGELIAFAPSGLTKYTIPNSVTSIGYCAFFYCSSLTSVTIPDSITSIGDQAFGYCSSLTSVTIPNSVTSIGILAFHDCSSLKEVYCKPTTPPSGGGGMFDRNASGRKIYVPTASVSKYQAYFYWSDYASDIVGYNF